MTDRQTETARVAVDPALLALCRPYMRATGASAKHCVDEGLKIFLDTRAPAVLDLIDVSQNETRAKVPRAVPPARRRKTA